MIVCDAVRTYREAVEQARENEAAAFRRASESNAAALAAARAARGSGG